MWMKKIIKDDEKVLQEIHKYFKKVYVIPPSHTRIFLTSPYGSPTRSQSQASVNNSLVSVNNS